MPQLTGEQKTTLRILQVIAFNFLAYLCIGAPMAILPSYLHLHLGIGTVAAGFLISLQYFATFASRQRAGHLSDTVGPRQTVRYSLLACAASGALLALAALLRHSLWLSLGTLALSRLVLGTGESLSATGCTMWGIGRVGVKHTARVISWNGVATYSALAIGAPLGVFAASRVGFIGVGAIIFAISAAGFMAATRMAPTAPFKGERVPAGRILRGVVPYGLALALGGTGLAVITTFITLYFASLGWQGAALCLTVYGSTFVGTRLLFTRTISRYGGYTVAVVSFGVEACGLLLLGLSHSQALAYLGCGLAGTGFSLIFPALGVEAANRFPTSVRGSAIGIYSAFVDLSLFLAGPIAGAVINGFGYPALFLGTAGAVAVALGGTVWLASTVRVRAAEA